MNATNSTPESRFAQRVEAAKRTLGVGAFTVWMCFLLAIKVTAIAVTLMAGVESSTDRTTMIVAIPMAVFIILYLIKCAIDYAGFVRARNDAFRMYMEEQRETQR